MKLSDNISKTILLGLTILVPKIPLFVGAYLLSGEGYFFFNKFYFTAAMVILWSSFGFDFALNFTKTRQTIVHGALIANVLLSGVVMILISPQSWDYKIAIGVLGYSYFTAASGIYQFRILYMGEYRFYFLLQVLSALLILCVIITVKYIGEEGLIYFLPLSSLILLIIVFSVHNNLEKERFDNRSIIDLYKLGVSAFLINSIVPLLLAADKVIVNHGFDPSIANSYTFSWGITAPLFYIGNLFEKMIYATKRDELKLGNSFLLNGYAIILYSISALLFVFFFTPFLPQTVDFQLLKKICPLMLAVYSIYAILNFPLNGYLFKTQKKSKQKKIAVKYLAAGLLGFLIFLIFREFILSDYLILILFNFSILALLLLIKIGEIFGLKKSMAELYKKTINKN